MTINGQNGLKAYYDVYAKDMNAVYYVKNTTNIIMDNIGDISKIDASNQNGLFRSFEGLVSVKASNLSGTISKGAFNQCYNLGSFNESGNYKYIIPESVTTISDEAFAEAGKNVADGFSANVESGIISKDAFQNSGLREINLPNATTIEEGAFTSCAKLTKVTLGQNDVDVVGNAFDSTAKTIYVNNEKLKNKLTEIFEKTIKDTKIKVELIQK